MPTEKAYPSFKVPINGEKLRDTTKSIKYIPEVDQEFYRQILNFCKRNIMKYVLERNTNNVLGPPRTYYSNKNNNK